MLRHVAAASATLDVMAYHLERESVVSALSDAVGRGVRVRMVLDLRQEDNLPAAETLRRVGVGLRPVPSRFPHGHAKVLIVDRATALVMSANLNDWSMETEWNYALSLHDPGVLAELQAIFDADHAVRAEAPAQLQTAEAEGGPC